MTPRTDSSARREVAAMKYLDISLATRLRLVRARVGARLFCWLAEHAPRIAEAWAFRGSRKP